MQKDLPSRTSSQIRTHAQKFFIRLRGKAGTNDAEILAYIRSKPAQFFVNETHRFARLGLESRGFVPAASEARTLSSPCAAKSRITNPSQASAGSTNAGENGAGSRTDGWRPSSVSSTCPGAEGNGLDGQFNNGHRNSEPHDDEKIKDYQGENKTGIHGSGLSSAASRSEGFAFPLGLGPVTSSTSIKDLADENLVLNQSLVNAFTGLTAFSRQLSASNEAGTSKHTAYLRAGGVELQCLMQNMASSLSKSTSLIQQLLLYTIASQQVCDRMLITML